MKKRILTFIALSVILFSCSNNTDRAKKLIKEELSKSLNDFKSYEPVQYGTLDSTFTSFDDTKYRLDDSLEMMEDKKGFKPILNGFRIEHSFRAKNSFGAYVLTKYYFFFDPELKKVEEYYDIEKEKERREELLKSSDLDITEVDTTVVDLDGY